MPCPIPPDMEVDGFDNFEGEMRAKVSVIRSNSDMIELYSDDYVYCTVSYNRRRIRCARCSLLVVAWSVSYSM
jgi:hypothetical protein